MLADMRRMMMSSRPITEPMIKLSVSLDPSDGRVPVDDRVGRFVEGVPWARSHDEAGTGRALHLGVTDDQFPLGSHNRTSSPINS